ncbi:hypothetical protein BRD07_07540 [Halobacteriales archaeon QS_9_68_42]|nr:MAG: hypothetical protein BRD07_07540 [Halobacteriales archaeon QS_9_68_42]
MADRGDDGRERGGGDGSSLASRELGFCPCCGYRTLSPGQPGSYEICEIRGWLDDLVGFYHPETRSDYDHVSLSQARENVAKYGACLSGVGEETRDPRADDEQDPDHPHD